MAFEYVFAFVMMLSVLIFVHELGHFLVAKACGVRVLKFSLGFGNPIGIVTTTPYSTGISKRSINSSSKTWCMVVSAAPSPSERQASNMFWTHG